MRCNSLFISLLILAGAFLNRAQACDDPSALYITKHRDALSCSAEFNLTKDWASEGRVLRTGGMSPRYFYDFFDAEETFQARGITRALSWGFFYGWGVEIDVYDAEQSYLGLVQGQWLTAARAKFVFHDASGEAIAIAYLNTETPEFLIVSAQDETLHLGRMYLDNYGDLGSVVVKHLKRSFSVDERIFKVFAAFVADYNHQFLPPPKIVHNTVFIYVPAS